MSKRSKLSSQLESMENRISQLPDEILVTILSRLTLRQAARTSIVSRRWKTLWTFITGHLNFVDPGAKSRVKKNGTFSFLEEERKKYSTWVNKVTKSHQAAIIDGFKVCFELDNTYKSDLDSWIEFAIRKKSLRLEIDLERNLTFQESDLYTFPKEVLSLSSIKFLTALRLCRVDVSGPVLEDILYKCPSLEALSVSGSKTLLGAKVCGLNLKFLEILAVREFEYIELSAGNLVCLVYDGPDTASFRIRHAPKLERIWLGPFNCFPLFPGLSPIFCQIDTLHMNFGLFPDEIIYPEFKNLKHLELRIMSIDDDDQSSFSCIPLIKACPMLCKLKVEFMWIWFGHKPREVKKIEGLELKCLQVVEFIWFAGRTFDIELAIAILENAPHVEKIIFKPWNPHSELGSYLFEKNPLLPPDSFDESKCKTAAIECVTQLAKKHSPNAKLVVL